MCVHVSLIEFYTLHYLQCKGILYGFTLSGHLSVCLSYTRRPIQPTHTIYTITFFDPKTYTMENGSDRMVFPTSSQTTSYLEKSLHE